MLLIIHSKIGSGLTKFKFYLWFFLHEIIFLDIAFFKQKWLEWNNLSSISIKTLIENQKALSSQLRTKLVPRALILYCFNFNSQLTSSWAITYRKYIGMRRGVRPS